MAAVGGPKDDANKHAAKATSRPHDGLLVVVEVQPRTIGLELAYGRTPHFRGNMYLALLFLFCIIKKIQNIIKENKI